MKATTDFSDASLLKTWIWWAQWKMAWNEEMGRNEPRPLILKGLLHGILKARISEERREEEFRELFDFCLDVADGLSWFEDPSKDFTYARQEIAKKAWNVLLMGFLRNMVSNNEDKDEYDKEKWLNRENFFNKESTTAKLLWFYGSPKNNVPDRYQADHGAKYSRNFAKNFCRFVLDNGTSELCRSSHPKIIELLHKIGSLDILLESDRGIVSRDGMNRLRELALAEIETPPVPRDEFEAIHRGSKTAEIFLILDLKRGLRAQQRWDESVGGRDVPL